MLEGIQPPHGTYFRLMARVTRSTLELLVTAPYTVLAYVISYLILRTDVFLLPIFGLSFTIMAKDSATESEDGKGSPN